MTAMQQRADGGWEPAVPEPFWFRSWRSLWRWRPGCYDCSVERGPVREGTFDPARSVIFKDRAEWGAHWRQHHAPNRHPAQGGK